MTAKIFVEMTGDLKIPAIGLGTGALRDETALEETLSTALTLGYRHIDTAYTYKNEVFIGRVLKKWFSSGKLKREDIFITTKLPLYGVHEDRVEMFMKKSLENLQLDFVDLYLIHWPIGTKYFGDESENNFKEVDEFDHLKIWKKMEEQVYLGRTKSIGLSNFNQRQIERIVKSAKIKPSCLQVEVHVDFQQHALVDFCQKNNIVVVGYCPLGSPGKSMQERNVLPVIDSTEIKRIAEKYDRTPGQIMLRYLLQRNIAAVPKSSKPERLKENIQVFDFNINSEDMKALENLEVGEKSRLADLRIISGIEQHPEYPFRDLNLL